MLALLFAHFPFSVLVILLLYLLSSYKVDARRGVNRHHSHSMVQFDHSRHSVSPLLRLDKITNYPTFSQKLINSCSPSSESQRVLVRRSTPSKRNTNYRTFLQILSETSPTKQSLDLVYNLVISFKNSFDYKQEENSPERSRRETEQDAEFLIKKLELRNLVDGLQILINEHILQVDVTFV